MACGSLLIYVKTHRPGLCVNLGRCMFVSHSAEISDLSEMPDPFVDDLVRTCFYNADDVLQHLFRYLRGIVRNKAFAGGGYPDLCAVCLRLAFRDMNVDRLQRIVLI